MKQKLVLSEKELHFKVKPLYKGQRVWLRVWKSRLHAPINPDNTVMIYMRLSSGEFSVPFTEENASLSIVDTTALSLLKYGSFTFPLENEEKIIAILSKLTPTNNAST